MSNLLEHKKARHDYEILETYEAGVQLFGTEVKALRARRGKLEGAHISVRGGEAFLLNAEIPPYQPSNAPSSYDPMRNRRLLLTKKELAELANAEDKEGHTIIPLAFYDKGRMIKLKIGIARGKKKTDKRQDILKREHLRDVARAVKDEVRRGVRQIGKHLGRE